jgi:hypothetical protein
MQQRKSKSKTSEKISIPASEILFAWQQAEGWSSGLRTMGPRRAMPRQLINDTTEHSSNPTIHHAGIIGMSKRSCRYDIN